jgi:hypothetical protein
MSPWGTKLTLCPSDRNPYLEPKCELGVLGHHLW